MTLVAGSYEKYIWGFSFRPKTLTITRLFSHPAHAAPIKCVAAAGPLAASGASDDTIKLYDIRARQEISDAPLIGHAGTVTALAFFASPVAPSVPRNLLSASDDDSIRIYDASDSFVHLTTVQVHRRGVSDLAIHPSGRAALTVGRDACLALLNLVRGRRSFSCRLDREASIVRYAPGGGDKFFLVAEQRVTVHDSEDARMIQEMEAAKSVLCVAPAENGILYTGGEDRCITAWDTASGKVAHQVDNAHSTRIKGLVVFGSRNEQDSGLSNFIASASSDGVIRVWDARMISNEKPSHLAEVKTQARITCFASSST